MSCSNYACYSSTHPSCEGQKALQNLPPTFIQSCTHSSRLRQAIVLRFVFYCVINHALTKTVRAYVHGKASGLHTPASAHHYAGPAPYGATDPIPPYLGPHGLTHVKPIAPRGGPPVAYRRRSVVHVDLFEAVVPKAAEENVRACMSGAYVHGMKPLL